MKVVLGIPHALLREGLRDLLKRWSGIEVVGVAPSARDAARVVERADADVLIVSRSARPAEDARAVEAVRESEPRCRVVVLEDSGRSTEDDPFGADWRVRPSIGPSGLVRGLWDLCDGEPARREEASDRGCRPHSEARVRPLLTDREYEVVRAVCEGLSNKQIAQRLGISDKTVKNHLFSVYRRTKVTGRTQLVLWAMGRGLGATATPSDP